MSVQFIENKGVPEYAVIPVDQYQSLLDKAEAYDDVVAFDKVVACAEETIPAHMVSRLVKGDNKIKVWREYRQITQAQLAERAGVAQAYIGQIETGQRDGTVKVLVVIAEALGISLDDLV
ncbi:MAG: helix-turn-helix domain-containing protein [Methylococcaceae bacterium]|nr:helix-turn-helix domain-containing protein [Methylococcaceae bacterium]